MTGSTPEQPQSVTVNYPEGAEYLVAVDHPENVASYQWYMEDPAGQVFELEGETAKTDTLKILSTYDKTATDKFYCTITDKDGKTVTSNKASLSIANYQERKPVLYVAEYAVEPGETLAIETTGMSGSGTVTFSEDGKEIIFNDFKMTNDWYSAGHIVANTFGVELYYLEAPSEDYKITLNGENVINNIHFDLERGCGPDLALIVTTPEAPATCTIECPGSLTLSGGDYGILSYLDLFINTSSIKTEPNLEVKRLTGFMTVGGADLTICSGVTLDMNVIGPAAHVDGNLVLESGSKLLVTSRAPYLPADFTFSARAPYLPADFTFSASQCIYLGGTMSMQDAELVINAIGDPAILPKGYSVPVFTGIQSFAHGILSAENSKITVNMSALDNAEPFVHSVGAIDISDFGSINLRSTDLTVNVDSNNIYDGLGIIVLGDFYVKDGSNVSVNVKTNGRARGIIAYPQKIEPESGNFEIIDSNLTVITESLTGDVEDTVGIHAGKNCFISLSEGNSVRSTAKGGNAFVALTGEGGNDAKGYQLGYKPWHIIFGENTDCVLPDPCDINLTSVPGTIKRWDYAETFYALGEHETPADDVLITYVEPAPPQLISIKDAVVSDIPDQTFTGRAIEPKPVVTLDGVTLIKDVDYTLSYQNNVNPGEARVIITGTGKYTDSTTKTFKITSAISPKTGDNSGIMLWISLLGAAAVLGVGTVVARRKYSKNK